MQQHNPQTKKKMKQEIFFFFYCKITQQGKMMTRSKPREIKRKLWLKAQIANRIRVLKCNKAITTTPILTLA
jgi:hypothetical protein